MCLTTGVYGNFHELLCMHCLSGLPLHKLMYNAVIRERGSREIKKGERRRDKTVWSTLVTEEGGNEALLYLTLGLFWSNETFVTWRLV